MVARNSRVSFSRASMVDAASGRMREEPVDEQLNVTWDEERGHQIMQQRQRTGDR